MKNSSDLELIDKIKADNISAFRELYVRYSDLIYRNIRVRLNNEFDADDILQGYFLLLWEKRKDINVQTSVRGYLLVWLRNYILDCLRMEKIRQQYEDNYFQGEEDDETWQHIITNDLKENIQKIAETFPPRMYDIYHLRHEENYTIKEIAQEMSISEQTVKNQLGEIMKRFRAQIKNNTFLFFL